MALKPSMTLKMGQQLRMTPQLQQAIRLLQLSSVELELEIQQTLDSNFMLEEVDPEADDTIDDEPLSETDPEPEVAQQETGSSHEEDEPPPNPELDGEVVTDATLEVAGESMGEELPVDTSWDDIYDETFVTTGSGAGSEFSDENFLETRNAESVSIASHLTDQLSLMNLTESDAYIAACIIDGLDNNGVLQLELEEIVEFAPSELELELDEVEAVLHLIQHLDPLGVASRSLQECLLIQLKYLPSDTPLRAIAIQLVETHIKYLANRDYTQLARKLKVKEDQLKSIITLIQSLDPRPGSSLSSNSTDYVEPDVMVSKQAGRWTVELNPKSAPRVRVNPEYSSLIKRGDTSNGATQMKNHLQEAKWFIKSLQQRNETLLRVSTKIVEFQRGFFEYGDQAMKPLVLHDIAEAVDLHESTISRVTTNKYMLTPSGLYELKYFFSSHVSTSSGGEVSSTAIRALIKELVADENPRKPLSDSKLSKLLEAQNIKVARRTIAKYRDLLMIPPSNERKQLI
jgi:RNA polymerase sigma-54 factor